MSSFLSPFRLIRHVQTRREIARQKKVDPLDRPQNGVVVTPLINTGSKPVAVAETFVGRHRLQKKQ